MSNIFDSLRLQLISYPKAKTGFGEICRDIIYVFHNMSIKFGVTNIYENDVMNGDYTKEEDDIIREHTGEIGDAIDFEFLVLGDMTNRESVFYTMYESNVWPTVSFNGTDIIDKKKLVIVPNLSNLEAIRRNSSTVRVMYAPCGINTNIYKPSNEPKEGKLKFIFVGTAGPHKNLRGLADTFISADVDAELHIHCPYPEGKAIRELKDYLKDGRIFLTTNLISKSDYISKLCSCDVFFSMSFGEGRGVFVQAMACGLPALIPDSISSRDYMLSRDHGWLIPISKLDRSSIGRFKDQVVSVPSKDAAVGIIREIVSMSRKEILEKGINASKAVSSVFNRERCVRNLLYSLWSHLKTDVGIL